MMKIHVLTFSNKITGKQKTFKGNSFSETFQTYICEHYHYENFEKRVVKSEVFDKAEWELVLKK